MFVSFFDEAIYEMEKGDEIRNFAAGPPYQKPGRRA